MTCNQLLAKEFFDSIRSSLCELRDVLRHRTEFDRSTTSSNLSGCKDVRSKYLSLFDASVAARPPLQAICKSTSCSFNSCSRILSCLHRIYTHLKKLVLLIQFPFSRIAWWFGELEATSVSVVAIVLASRQRIRPSSDIDAPITTYTPFDYSSILFGSC